MVTPFVAMPSTPTAMTMEVIHKATKTQVTATVTPTYSASRATFTMPSLTSIQSVAKQGDEVLVQISLAGVRYYQELGYWIVGAYDMYHEWKDWDTTALQSNAFITL